MKKTFILALIFTLATCTTFSQTNNTWIAYGNSDSSLIGFKDKNGIVKTNAIYGGITRANNFDDIIAVTEEANEHWNSYYLTKAGRIVGTDSIHIFDNLADCESESFIRFRDNKTDKVGMFNSKGDIVIPAVYNDLSIVKNGMVIALIGAVKRQRGEHYSWQGGKDLLIDTSNRILIDSFRYKDELNFFSLLVSPKPSVDTIRQNFKGVNGQNYSFIVFEKEFQTWLYSSLLNNFTEKNLLESADNKITFWKEPDGWTSEPKGAFLKRNFELIKRKLLELKSATCDFNIFDEGLNPYIYDSTEYKDFFNNCGESKDWIYPVKSIVISYKQSKNLVQDHFDFLRTDKGYKLISVTIRNGVLK